MERTELNILGEFGLIDRIASQSQIHNPTTIKGIGDDAAVVVADHGYQLLSSELLIEGVHFDLGYVPLKHLGYKVVVAGISDILAMNGTPKQITINIGLSNRFSVEAIDELYAGIFAACEDYEVELVGGDTTSSRSGLILSISAIGTVETEKITYRKGANANDIICVTGDLGGAYLGLQILEREKKVFLEAPEAQPVLTGHEYVLQRQLKPDARLDIIKQLRELNIVPTSMIDVSDGLASELRHLAAESGLGVRVFEEQIPIHQKSYLAATELKLGPFTAALNGGEDYELLFTIRQEDYQKILDHTTDISFIGFMSSDPTEAFFITKQNEAVPLTAQGWEK
ncbi:thiamine-phosphate kinase [Siphonobacter sp. SORGH_AS_1065]|uniref:thiamine-phosphate kinase n=1 Tax=Siphonobacter sp. SORGH_AS_1065 TaxID=3041795 RepID=UPI0027838037|nr:thiamine-phosphate kinase [Siphonobacter sp. SORGH_AS_1065]MDQ1086838.1 thiamine-monophosphate kinase [Siphonobacter sp. SORGH_AS_1065]